MRLCMCIMRSKCWGGVFDEPINPVEPPVEKPEAPTTPPSTEYLLTIKIEDDIMAVVGTNTWNAIVWSHITSPGSFVAVGNGGYLVTSLNKGATWLSPQKKGTENWNSVAAGSAKVIACGNNGYIVRSNSPSVINWLSPVQVCNANLKGIAYGNETFVAVSDNQYIVTSNDEGATWTTPVKVLAAWYSIAFGDGKFVTVGTAGNIATSSDNGKTWSKQTVGSSGSTWYAITYGNGKFVAVGQAGVTISKDGIDWTTPTKVWGAGVYCYSIAYCNGIFIASSDGGYVSTSVDGTEWSNLFKLTDESGSQISAKINGIMAI